MKGEETFQHNPNRIYNTKAKKKKSIFRETRLVGKGAERGRTGGSVDDNVRHSLEDVLFQQ